MPRLQYSNPNKTCKLFTNASKHIYSTILHQDEIPNGANVVPNLVPIPYFWGSFSKIQQLWNTTKTECYAVYRSIQKFLFYLAGTKCTLYCNHKPLGLFFTAGVFSPVLGATAVWHPIWAHLRQEECSGWCYIQAQNPGLIPRWWQWWPR